MGTNHKHSKPMWCWETGYADVGPCIEMNCVYDDTLKKDLHFCNFAVDVAQEILGEGHVVTFGKWGARLEMELNPGKSTEELESAAEKVRKHPSWTGLLLATHVFTFGQ